MESNLSKQIAAIEVGARKPVMRVGNLDATRDFTDVRDIVRAYWLALKAGEPGEVYNICTGSALSIRQLLDTLLGLSTVQGIQIKSDPQRMRPSDVLNLLGDCSKFRQATGWKPERTLDTTLRDLLTNWRDRLRKDPPGDRRPVHAHRS